MYASSALAFLLAFSAATPALAQGCTERAGSFLISCVNNQCDTSEVAALPTNICGAFGAGLSPRFSLESNDCNRQNTCEYQVRGSFCVPSPGNQPSAYTNMPSTPAAPIRWASDMSSGHM